MLHGNIKYNLLHATLLIGLTLAHGPTTACAQKKQSKPVVPTRTWQGKIRDEALMKAAPASGFIADAKEWETLWKVWRGDEKVPAVDFRKEIVVLAIYGGPNSCTIIADLEDNGNLRIICKHTLLEGPGFGYQLGTVPRAGIKSVNGKMVPRLAP